MKPLWQRRIWIHIRRICIRWVRGELQRVAETSKETHLWEMRPLWQRRTCIWHTFGCGRVGPQHVGDIQKKHNSVKWDCYSRDVYTGQEYYIGISAWRTATCRWNFKRDVILWNVWNETPTIEAYPRTTKPLIGCVCVADSRRLAKQRHAFSMGWLRLVGSIKRQMTDLICGAWLIDMWRVTHWYVARDSLICGAWLIDI